MNNTERRLVKIVDFPKELSEWEAHPLDLRFELTRELFESIGRRLVDKGDELQEKDPGRARQFYEEASEAYEI